MPMQAFGSELEPQHAAKQGLQRDARLEPRQRRTEADMRTSSEREVRRRHDCETAWLDRRNDWYELDDLTDLVWLECEGGTTVEQIARSIGSARGLSFEEALAVTVLAIDRFRELQLLDLT